MTGYGHGDVDLEKSDTDVATLKDTIGAFAPLANRYWSRPLCDYAAAIYQVARPIDPISHRVEAMTILKNRFKIIALNRGYTQAQCLDLEQQLSDIPVIQTGPHSHLLIDPDALYTNLFSLLGLQANQSRWQIWFSASTVKLTERGKKGPGWLKMGPDSVNIFGLSRRHAGRYHVLSENGPYRFRLAGEKDPQALDDQAKDILNRLPNAAYSSAADAIKSANMTLWADCFDQATNLLQFDDIDVADLIADHLEDEASWLSQRLFKNSTFVDAHRSARRALNDGHWAGWVKETTDFFWGIADHRIVPLRLDDGRLVDIQNAKFSMAFERQAVIVGLRERALVPNLFMTFLVIGILPGVRLLGGCKQIIYYPLMRHLLAQSLDPNQDRALLDAMRGDVHPSVWGHRVLVEEEPSPTKIFQASWGLEAARLLGARSLGESCGNLPRFASDPLWAKLSALTSNGRVSRHADEWQWGDYR
jgi:hypothetical protein